MRDDSINMHQLKALSCAPVLLILCACGGSGTSEAGDELQTNGQEVSEGPVMADRTLGPIEYSFDESQLTLTEVVLALPPDYENTAFASKLIPEERAQMLGTEQCSYGQSGLTTACDAEKEAGLALSLLERPIEEYREAFAERGIKEALKPSSLGGAAGFAFTAQAEGSGTEYRFLSVDEQTLLLARTFRSGQDQDAAAIEEVIASLAKGIEDHLSG